jgi:hypothetical protein
MLVTQPMRNTEDLKLLFWHGSLNVPIEHHPAIRYMVYNGYYKVMSNIPKMGQLPTPVWWLLVVIYFQSYSWRGQMLLDQDCVRVFSAPMFDVLLFSSLHPLFGHRHIWVPCSHPWFLHGAWHLITVYYIWYLAIWRFPNLGGTTPESFMYEWIWTINHPFWGTSIYGNLHMLYLFLLDSSIVTEMEQSEFDWSSLSVSRPDFKATLNTPHKPWFSMGFTHLWSILWHDFEDVWYQHGIIGHIH